MGISVSVIKESLDIMYSSWSKYSDHLDQILGPQFMSSLHEYDKERAESIIPPKHAQRLLDSLILNRDRIASEYQSYTTRLIKVCEESVREDYRISFD